MKRGAEWESKNAKNMDYSLDMKFFTRSTVNSVDRGLFMCRGICGTVSDYHRAY
jgi:hypothetical protein